MAFEINELLIPYKGTQDIYKVKESSIRLPYRTTLCGSGGVLVV